MTASDCLQDRLRNDLECVERDVKTYSQSLTHEPIYSNRQMHWKTRRATESRTEGDFWDA